MGNKVWQLAFGRTSWLVHTSGIACSKHKLPGGGRSSNATCNRALLQPWIINYQV